MIRVVLADDETLLRSAITALISFEPDIEVVGQAADGAEAIRVVRQTGPDVVILDLEMPGIDGLAAAVELREQNPGLPVVLLTRHARPGVLRAALAAGVRGFASKSVEPEELARIIRTVHDGRRHIDTDIATAAMLDDCPLTDRELDVLRAASDGTSIRAIATRLFLAPGTVRNYLSQAMAKTGGDTRHAAARIARERGWL